MKKIHLILTITIAFALTLTFPKNAYAYLDPGSINYFLQIMVAVLTGVAYALKLYWTNVKIFVKKLFSKKEQSKS